MLAALLHDVGELYIDPAVWADLGDRDLAQGVVHSHLSSPPRPSRTDVENIGLWEGRPYLIYSLREDSIVEAIDGFMGKLCSHTRVRRDEQKQKREASRQKKQPQAKNTKEGHAS